MSWNKQPKEFLCDNDFRAPGRTVWEWAFAGTTWKSGITASTTDTLDLRGYKIVNVFYRNSTDKAVAIIPTPMAYIMGTQSTIAWRAMTALTTISLATGTPTETHAARMFRPIAQCPTSGDSMNPAMGVQFSCAATATGVTAGNVSVIVEGIP